MTDKELMKAIGLNRETADKLIKQIKPDWEFLFKTHDEVVARHKPTGRVWRFRY